VVGGLAVLCRLTHAHRATIDLDLVDTVEGPGHPPQLEILRGAPGSESSEPAAAVIDTPAGPVKVDVIAINQADIDHPSDNVGDRLHAMSHAWAQETATDVAISVVAANHSVLAEAAALVAQPGPLVAMKLQAVMNRVNGKEGTDLLDIVRLTLDPRCGALVSDQIAGQPEGMRKDIGEHVNGWFRIEAQRTLERVRLAGGANLDIDSDGIDLVAELLLAACEPR
jgi:hypothetical protein